MDRAKYEWDRDYEYEEHAEKEKAIWDKAEKHYHEKHQRLLDKLQRMANRWCDPRTIHPMSRVACARALDDLVKEETHR